MVRTTADATVPEYMDRDEYSSLRKYATEYGVDYRLVLAIIRQESRFDPEALSDRAPPG